MPPHFLEARPGPVARLAHAHAHGAERASMPTVRCRTAAAPGTSEQRKSACGKNSTSARESHGTAGIEWPLEAADHHHQLEAEGGGRSRSSGTSANTNPGVISMYAPHGFSMRGRSLDAAASAHRHRDAPPTTLRPMGMAAAREARQLTLTGLGI